MEGGGKRGKRDIVGSSAVSGPVWGSGGDQGQGYRVLGRGLGVGLCLRPYLA